MPKTLGPHAGGLGRGIGFWAQSSIILGPSTGQIEWRNPHFTPAWTYPLPGGTYIFSPLPLSPPTLPIDTTHELRTPHFSLPRAPDQGLRSWAWSYNLNLIGQDQLTVGEQVYDLPPIGPLQPLRRWEWSYNLNLIGKDQLPVGKRITDIQIPQVAIKYDIYVNSLLFTAAAAIPFNQSDWPVPIWPPRAIDLRTWFWSYNLNLIGQDKLPTGEQVFDLPPRAYPEPATRTWVWSYNLNLIGKDRLPTGKSIYDLPPFGPLQPLRSWTASYNLNLIGQDQLPVGLRIFDLPPRDYLQPAKTWTWSYNLNLIGKDQLPIGEAIYDLPPRAYPPPGPTWAWAYNTFVAPPPTLPIGGQITALPPPLLPSLGPSWTWWYNLNLVGQDRLPVGEQVFDLPPKGYEYATSLRSWTQNLIAYTLKPLPYGVQIYDLPPRDYLQPAKTWTWSYNLNLIGQDAFPVGARVTDLPPRDYLRPIDVRTWINQTNQALIASVGVPPPNQYDWPNPKAPLQPLRSWTWSYNLDLIGQDQLPTGKQVSDLSPKGYPEPATRTWVWNYNLNLIGKDKLPTGTIVSDRPPLGPLQPLRSWTWNYNLNLIGKDQLPTGEQVTDLPPQGPQYPTSNKTWITQVNLALTTAQVRLPFNQYDWPNPKLPQQPTTIWTSSYNLNLIGQDRLPIGKQVFDRPTLPIVFVDRSFTFNLPRSLLVPPAPLPHNQYDWPLPTAPRRDPSISSWTFSSFFQPPTPPPIFIVSADRPWVRDYWDRDEWGNFYPGSGIHRG